MTADWRLMTADWRVKTNDWRLETNGCRLETVPHSTPGAMVREQSGSGPGLSGDRVPQSSNPHSETGRESDRKVDRQTDESER